MVSVHHHFRSQRDKDEARWVANLVREAKAEEATNPMNVDEALAESERLARSGTKRAKKIGIKTEPKSVNQVIHERRKTRKSA